MILNKEVLLKFAIICLISVSFFLGYFLRENAAGGGLEFYELSWPIIQSFKKDFLFSIKNYGSFRDYTIPFSHILNAYINPFSNDIENFQLSITIISFAIFLIFALVLKNIFKHINFVDILLASSTILLLPFFRTSAFWGKNENYGWLFFILALYFFSEIKKNISKIPNNQDILNIIFFVSQVLVHFMQDKRLLFLLPISYLLYLFFNNANKKIIITSIISFAIFAIPGFLLIWIWGNVFPTLPPGMKLACPTVVFWRVDSSYSYFKKFSNFIKFFWILFVANFNDRIFKFWDLKIFLINILKVFSLL